MLLQRFGNASRLLDVNNFAPFERLQQPQRKYQFRLRKHHYDAIVDISNVHKEALTSTSNWLMSYTLSGFKCTFSCIVQYSLYHNMDIGTMWHCTLVSSTPSQSMGLVLGCALFWCWVSLGAPVTISLIYFYFIMIFIMIVVTIIGIFMAIDYFLNNTLGFLYPSSSGSANAQLPGCFRPWTFSLNIGLNMLPLCHVYNQY